MKKQNCGLRRAYAQGGLLGAENILAQRDNFNRFGQQRQAMETAARQSMVKNTQSQMDELSGARLSPGRKARMMAELGGDLSKMGVSTDLSSLSRGLSPGRAARIGLAQADIANNVTGFNLNQSLKQLDMGERNAQFDTQYDSALGGALAASPAKTGFTGMTTGEGNLLSDFNKRMGYAKGGTVGVDERGFIEGPGGVDKVPARVDETGEEIRVGAGERIVNQKQNAALEALAEQAGMTLDEYLEASTQEPVGPTMKNGLRAAQNGWPVPYDPIRAQQPAPGGANTYVPRSTVPVQDGVRIPQQAAQAQRPNWVDPTRQVAPVYEAPRSAGGSIGQAANVLDGQSVRVANGSDRAIVPTSGKTQFHDKISAEEIARGNQNRAAGFRTAAENTAKAPAGMAAGLRTAGRLLGPVGMAAPVATAVMSDAPTVQGKLFEAFGGDSSVTQQQRDDAAYAKKNAKLPIWAGPNGAMVSTAQLAAVGAETRAKDRAPHDSLRANFVDGNGTGKFNMPVIDKAAGRKATADSLRNAETETTAGVQSGYTTGAAETARVNGLDYANLEPATKTGRADFMGEKDATEYQLPAGATGGFVTRSGKGGLRNTTYLSGAPSAADAARDKEFAAKGYGKDAYGNWVTPQRIADKQSLAQMQFERAKFNAFSDQITDPNARRAGLRQVAFTQAQSAQQDARDAAAAKNQLEVAKFDQEERKMRNLQGNADREFTQKQSEAQYKRLDDMLKAQATNENGEFDGKKYAWLQQYAGNFKSDAKKGSEAYFKDLMANLELDDRFMQDQGGLFRPVRNQGADPVRGFRQESGPLWGKYMVDPATNKRVSQSELAKMSPSAREELVRRIQAQQ